MGGFNVRDMLAAEQAKFQGEITEDKFKYKKYELDLSLPINELKFLFSIVGVLTIPLGEFIGIKGRAKWVKVNSCIYLLP